MYFSYTSFLAMVMTHSTIFSSAKEFKPPTKQQQRDENPLDFPPNAQYLPGGIQITPPTDLSTQIVGGTEVYPVGRYEYMVSLQLEGYGHFCGGSLVAANWILSAAHCAGAATHIEIGRHNLGVLEGSAETIEVEYEIIHPGYDSSTMANDVMLIKLKENSSYTPVTLDNGSNSAITANNADVTVFGWGTTSSGGPSSSKLLEVDLDVVSDADCNEDYLSSGYFNTDPITDDMICAARYGKDSCQGDSGGPLIMKGSNAGQDIQVGIVSWGFGCADPSYPGVYSRASSSYDWISSIISQGQGPCDNTITVRVKTDRYPDETSWSLIDTENNNAVIAQRGNYINGDTLYENEICVNPSCFSFTIQDTAGDGICCGYGDGYYQVLLDGEEVASGGEFGASESKDFCSPETTPPTVSPNQPPSVYNGLINIYQCDKYTLEEIVFPPSLTEGQELTVCLENVGEDESIVVSEILEMVLVHSENGSSVNFGVIANGEEDLTNGNLVTYWCEAGKCAASIVLIDEFFEYGEETTLGVTGEALLGSSENGKVLEEENKRSFSLSVALDGGYYDCYRSGMLSLLSKAFGF